MPFGATNPFCPRLNDTGVGNSLLVSKSVNKRVLATNAVTNTKVLNGTLGLGTGTTGTQLGKINAKYKTFAFTATGVVLQVTHGLGRTPVGYLIIAPSKAGVVYRGSTNYLRATQVYVKCNATVAGTMIVW